MRVCTRCRSGFEDLNVYIEHKRTCPKDDEEEDEDELDEDDEESEENFQTVQSFLFSLQQQQIVQLQMLQQLQAHINGDSSSSLEESKLTENGKIMIGGAAGRQICRCLFGACRISVPFLFTLELALTSTS